MITETLIWQISNIEKIAKNKPTNDNIVSKVQNSKHEELFRNTDVDILCWKQL